MPAAKPKATSSIAAVLGSDEAEVRRAAKELAAQMSPGGDFGTEVIDGSAENADAAAERVQTTIQALLTFPFFGGEKLVWLKNVNFLADTPTGRAQGVAEALEKLTTVLTDGLPLGTRFLLSAIEVDKRRSFYKSLAKLGKVEVHDRLDTSKTGWEEAAGHLVAELARARGLHFSAEALEYFILSTGGDRRVIESEIEKLDLYLGTAGREVSIEEVRLLVPVTKAGVVFELGNAIAARDLPRALELLDQLMFQGENAVGILLVAIIPTVRNLLVVSDLMARHRLPRPQQPFFFGKTLERLPPAAIAHLARKKDGTLNAYPLGIAASHAQHFKPAELREAVAACLDANVRLVTSGLDAKVVLGQLLVRLCAPSS